MRFACIYLLIYLYITIINSIIIFIFYYYPVLLYFITFMHVIGIRPKKIKSVIHTMYCTIMSLVSKDHESLANQ